MMTMTKKTIGSYQSDIRLIDPQWAAEIDEKLTQMCISGKTDGFATMENNGTIINRTWIDQSAAEEWVAFMTSTNLLFDIPNSFQIVDI